MLPTTGYFKNISCPFYDVCICKRPFCHFKHCKSEAPSNEALITELVTETVHEVLETSLTLKSNKKSLKVKKVKSENVKNVIYNPTPISELKKYKANSVKEHISIQCTSEYRSIISSHYTNLFDYEFESADRELPNYSTNSENSSQILTTEYNSANYKFIDDLSGPNIYEPIESIVAKKTNYKDEKKCSDDSKHNKSNNKDEIGSDLKRKVKKSSEEKQKASQKSVTSRQKSSNTNTRSSRSSSHSSKSKHKDKQKIQRKEEKQDHCCEKLVKNSDKVSKSHSASREKHKKSVESSDNREKSVKSDKISDQIIKFRGTSPDFNSESLSDYSEDELQQCKSIFENYQPPNLQIAKYVKPKSEIELVVPKKRIARDKSVKVVWNRVTKHFPIKSAALVMTNRYKQVLSSSENSVFFPQLTKRDLSVTKSEKSTDLTYSNPAKIKRIAHVSNVDSLLNAKKKIDELVRNKTPMQTITKGDKRIAHIPEMNLADIPPVLNSDNSKLPVNVRSRFLLLIVQECVKLYESKKAAYDRALSEELNCYSKCSVLTSYRNSVMLSINRLRKEAETGKSLSPKIRENSDFCGKKLYENIKKWVLTEDELIENGFPRPGAIKKGHAVFKMTKMIEKIPNDLQQCIRCKRTYQIDEKGFQLYPDNCFYHSGCRFMSCGEMKYTCCKESNTLTNTGCCTHTNHVFEVKDPTSLTGFVSTFHPEIEDDPKSYLVYALDCEMVYSTRGFELARVTVINSACEVIFETLVRPTGHILDCNTKFSGLTTEMLENATMKITEVQATLLSMFNSKTILIGHSLESDLKVLRLIHDTIIDTSVLFPHKMGPPRKRRLRELAMNVLKKIIQNDETGHDSTEDAVACMELVMWKLKEDIKLR